MSIPTFAANFHFIKMIKNNLKTRVLVAAIAFMGYGTMHAQVTTSGIQGIIAQSAGSTVTATHLPSGTVYTATANAEGQFNISNMRVGGPYQVVVTTPGKSPEVYDDIYLELGEVFTLKNSTKPTTSIGEVQITGRRRVAPVTGLSTIVGQKLLQELPQTASRSITDFTKLTPQANGTSFAGRDARYNNLQIDGANFNNGFGLSTNPLPGGNSQPISLDAIEEISVNIAPYDITQSGFTGAGINAITKSGTNQFHGSLYGYYTGKELSGWKIDGQKIDKVSGARLTNGLTVGGPLVKSKLFFFLSAEREMATGANASGSNLWKASQDGKANIAQNISAVKESDLIAVRDHLINRWGYDPGRYQGYADEAIQKGDKILARLDWNVNSRNKVAVRFNLLDGNSMQIVNGNSGPNPRTSWNRVSEKSMAFENANYSFKNKVYSVTGEWNSSINSKVSNKLLGTFTKIQDTRDTPGSLFPFVDIWNGSSTGGNYISFGTELFSYLNDVTNTNWSVTDNLTVTAGINTITGGVAYEQQNFGNSYTRMGTGYYRYASVADFLTTGTPNEVAPIQFGLTYPYEGMDTYARVNFGLGSAYLQDKITVNDRFNFTVGIRAELPFYQNDLTANPGIDKLLFRDQDGSGVQYSSAAWPKSRVMLSPRLGLNFDPMGDKTLIIRAGTGIFTGRVPFVWLTNQPTNAGVIQNTIEPNGYAASAPWIGQIRFHPEDIYYYANNPVYYNVNGVRTTPFISSPTGGAPGTIAVVDESYRMPSVWRTSFGIDYRIPNTPITFTGDFLYTKDVNATFQYAPNRQPVTTMMTSQPREYYAPAASGSIPAYQVNPAINANSVTVLTNTKVKGYSLSATAGISVRPVGGFSGSVFYTYSEAKDITSNPGSSANSAWSSLPSINNPNEQILGISDFALPHRVVANIAYYIKPSGTTIGVYYNGSHQGRYSYTYSNDVNGDGIASDLLYIPTDLNSIKFQNIAATATAPGYTAEQQRAAFAAFIQNNGLEKYAGGFVPRNAGLMPWLNRFDVRIAQDLFRDSIKKGSKLQITFDVINAGNLLNSKWGIQDNLLTAGRSPLAKVGNTATPDPSFQMQRDAAGMLVTTPIVAANNRFTTWSGMLGMRFVF